MNKLYIIKAVLSVLALSLWIASLFLPLFEESGAGQGTLRSGLWFLIANFTFGLIFISGIPWDISVIAFFGVLLVNLSGRRSVWVSTLFLVICIGVTALATVFNFYQVVWHYGTFFWLGSMYLMSFASYIESGESVPPRAT